MMKSMSRLLAVLLLPLLFATAQAEEYRAGVHYQVLPKPVRTADPSKVEVVEVFGYWCPHCNNFERYLKPWKKTLDDKVDFRLIPVVFRPNQAEFAKAYYVAKLLKVEDKAHPELFALIHRARQWINNGDELRAFFVGLGVDGKEFDKVYNSFALNSMMSIGQRRAREYRITGVPSMVVNGKYLVTAEMAGSQRNMLKVVDFLIEKETAAL